MTQAPNRKGNHSKVDASHFKGVTAVTRPQGNLSQPSGNQGAPSFQRASDNTAAGATAGKKQKVMVNQPKEYCTYTHNDGYLKNSSFLK